MSRGTLKMLNNDSLNTAFNILLDPIGSTAQPPL